MDRKSPKWGVNLNGKNENSVSKLLFGTIRRKLISSFIAVLFLMACMIYLAYDLNQRIAQQTTEIKEVEAPLEVRVEQVRAYDAILTGSTHAALLHALKNDSAGVAERQVEYDRTRTLMDDMLEKEAPALLEKSNRPQDQKEKIRTYLLELDRLNNGLVGLEVSAFALMRENKSDEAYLLIVGDEYTAYKKELAAYYLEWSGVEYQRTMQIRENILENSFQVNVVYLILGALAIISSSIIAVMVSDSIAKPIKELQHATNGIERGDYHARVAIKSGDELEGLGRTFNRSAEALEKMDDERKQIDKLKTEFLSITSHELRSPMTPMRAHLQMLLENYFGKMNPKQRESVQIILRNTERLDRILLDFLDISRIEAARLKFNYIGISLTDHILNVVKEMRGFMPEKKVRIGTHLEPLPVMKVDPDRAMQVLRNLLNNAIKISPKDGKIGVFAKKYDDGILISVKDNGIGIPKDQQPKIFEPFFQVGGMYQRTVGGTGLGLAICRGIVESQNGRIWFESEEGKGTQFYFTLPLVPPAEPKSIRMVFSSRKEIKDEEK